MHPNGAVYGIDELGGIVPSAILKNQLDLANIGDSDGWIAVDHHDGDGPEMVELVEPFAPFDIAI